LKLGSFEILYATGQHPSLGSDFLGFDAVSVNKSIYRELFAFGDFVRQERWLHYDLSGLFSPKFFSKTGISQSDYMSFIVDNPGYDVYLFHPYPRELSLANHFLELAELEHPGISRALSDVWCSIFRFPPSLVDAHVDKRICCHSNYFLGSQRFWIEYSVFVSRFIQFMESAEGWILREFTPYTLTKSCDRALPLGVFVFERALSIFLKSKTEEFRVINYAYSGRDWSPPEIFAGEEKFVNELLGMVEAVDQSKRSGAYTAALHTYYNYRRLRIMNNG